MKRNAVTFRALLAGLSLFIFPLISSARELEYSGGEARVFVRSGEPTLVSFPETIEGGYKKNHSDLALEKHGKDLIVFSQPSLPVEGEVLIIYLKNQRSFILRVVPADE